MFYLKQNKTQQEEYQKNLELIGSLSNLFSSSSVPLLDSRVVENLFCLAFNAENLGRADQSVDATKDGLGIGLKTFKNDKGPTYQKVAQFKAARFDKDVKPIEIAELRNKRITATEKVNGLFQSIYHCVLREKYRLKLFEESMNKIDLSKISNINHKPSSIFFDDGKDEYKYTTADSQLWKRFDTKNYLHEFEVQILLDPIYELRRLLDNNTLSVDSHPLHTIFLPLYSRDKNTKEKTVFPKSGLNQWNAKGRVRHPNEVYIPIPKEIHKLFPDYFPSRDRYFSIKFPDGEIVEASVCQAGSKALMTKKNKKLGKLILRDILGLKEGEIATYNDLESLDIDSVQIHKIDELNFEINFSRCDSYELFIANSRNN
jgi:hypothetical protein